MKELSSTLVFGNIIFLVPIIVFLPILHDPRIIEPGQIKLFSPIKLSCSIIDPVFIIECDLIIVFVLITVPANICLHQKF